MKAELKGDEYIVNGEKSSWVSNGSIATHAILHVSLNYMVVPDPDFITATGGQGLATVNGGMAVVFAGLAKAAFDEAFRYSRERVQGGMPLCGHPTIRLKLMKMFSLVEAARANARRMALYNFALFFLQPASLRSPRISLQAGLEGLDSMKSFFSREYSLLM